LKKALRGLPLWQPSIATDAVTVSTYLFQYETRLKSESATSQQMLELVSQYLTGAALEWYRVLSPGCVALSSWDDFKETITKEYQPELPFSVAFQRLSDCKKLANESYNAHLLRFNKAYSELARDAISHVSTLDTYIRCLDPVIRREVNRTHHVELAKASQLRRHAEKTPTVKSPTLAEVCQWAVAAEDVLTDRTGSQLQTTLPPKTSSATSTSSTYTATTTGANPTRNHQSTAAAPTMVVPGVSPNYRGKNPDPYYQQNRAAASRNAPSFSSSLPSSSSSQSRPAPATAPNSAAIQEQTGNSTRPPIECYTCHKLGHISRNCPTRKRSKPASDD
jgi:hypothetical protein